MHSSVIWRAILHGNPHIVQHSKTTQIQACSSRPLKQTCLIPSASTAGNILSLIGAIAVVKLSVFLAASCSSLLPHPTTRIVSNACPDGLSGCCRLAGLSIQPMENELGGFASPCCFMSSSDERKLIRSFSRDAFSSGLSVLGKARAHSSMAGDAVRVLLERGGVRVAWNEIGIVPSSRTGSRRVRGTLLAVSLHSEGWMMVSQYGTMYASSLTYLQSYCVHVERERESYYYLPTTHTTLFSFSIVRPQAIHTCPLCCVTAVRVSLNALPWGFEGSSGLTPGLRVR